MKTKLFMIAITVFCAVQVFAQNNADAVLAAQGQQLAVTTYKNTLNIESGLYNGPLYIDYLQTISEGNPFLDNNLQMVLGSVFYDGVLYENEPMMYDIYKKKLIVNSPAANIRFTLVNERIGYFIINGRHFRNIKADSIHKIPSNFYEVLFSGARITSYQLHQKTPKDDLSGRFYKIKLLDKNRFFIEKGGAIKEINRKKDVLNILNDERQEVSQFIRKEKLRFRKNIKNDLATITRFYEGL